MKKNRSKRVNAARSSGSQKQNQMIGMFILITVMLALFAVVASIPPKTNAQTGSIISSGQAQQTVPATNTTRPATTLRVIYTKP